jgi:hypothetical protein
MGEEYPETQYRKKNLVFGSTLLAGSIITGPVAPFVALVGVAFLAGTGLRHLLNKRAREAYYEEREERKVSSREELYPESPETAIAREEPFTTSKLLREYSQDRMYEEALNVASTVAQEYFSNLPPEILARTSGARVSFKKKRNLLGLIAGEEPRFKLDIELK